MAIWRDYLLRLGIVYGLKSFLNNFNYFFLHNKKTENGSAAILIAGIERTKPTFLLHHRDLRKDALTSYFIHIIPLSQFLGIFSYTIET